MARLLDSPIIAERYFFPRPAPLADPFVVAVDGADLHCWRSGPARDDRLTLLHFHGNGEVVSDYTGDWAPAVADFGVDVVLAEYRGYGGSSGRPALATMLDDALAVVDATGVPPERLLVYGRSVGGIFAVHVAAERPGIAGLVVESGVSDVAERLAIRVTPRELGVTAAELDAAVAADLDARDKLARYRGPLLVMHARDDELVGPHHAEKTHAWAAGDDKRIRWFERGGHNAILAVNWPDYLDELKRFVEVCRR